MKIIWKTVRHTKQNIERISHHGNITDDNITGTIRGDIEDTQGLIRQHNIKGDIEYTIILTKQLTRQNIATLIATLQGGDRIRRGGKLNDTHDIKETKQHSQYNTYFNKSYGMLV